MRMQTMPSNFGAIWWLHPGKLILFFTFPLYIFVALAVPTFWPNLIVLRTRVYMDQEYVTLGGLMLLMMGFGALFGGRLRFSEREQAPPVAHEINERFMWIIATLVILAYVIWFAPLLTAGRLLEREEMNQTPGVTSFTQLGITYVICYLYATQRSAQQMQRPTRILFRVVLFLTAARVYIWSERLALIEVVVPACVLILSYYQPRRRVERALFHIVSRYGPVLAIPLLLVFFGMTEMVRSWTSYSTKQDISMVEFMLSRIATYYYTALNNGAGMLATSSWPDFEFIFIFEWVYRLPFGIGKTLWEGLGRAEMPHEEFFDRFGDIEFNSISGFYPAIFDAGIVGGLCYAALLGLLMGIAYRQASRERPLGILMFPSMIVACFEMLRIMYLSDSRYFLVVVGAILASRQLRPRVVDRDSAPEAPLPPPRRPSPARATPPFRPARSLPHPARERS